jgi:hypothetical protein
MNYSITESIIAGSKRGVNGDGVNIKDSHMVIKGVSDVC